VDVVDVELDEVRTTEEEVKIEETLGNELVEVECEGEAPESANAAPIPIVAITTTMIAIEIILERLAISSGILLLNQTHILYYEARARIDDPNPTEDIIALCRCFIF
jgi:hypothetical protein